MKTMRVVLQRCTWKWKQLVLFELIYKLAGGFLLFPLLQNLLHITMSKAELTYLSMETLSTWLMRGPTFPLLILCILLLGIYIAYELFVLILYFDRETQASSLRFTRLLKMACLHTLRIIQPKNWLLFPMVLLLFPLTSIAFTSDVLAGLRIPEYILDFIHEQPMLNLAYVCFLILANLLAFLLLYALPIFVSEASGIYGSCRKSIRLIKQRFFSTLWFYGRYLLVFTLGYFLLCGCFLCYLLLRYRVLTIDPSMFLLSYMQLKQKAVFLYQMAVSMLSCALIMQAYQKQKKDGAEELSVSDRSTTKPSFAKKRVISSLFVIIIVYLSVGIYTDYQGNAFYLYGLRHQKQEISAHRAGSAFAPENTLAALDMAIQGKADYAEIDVQQTKDGELIILHDTDFKRVAGVNKKVWEVTSEEVRGYDAGSYFSQEFQGEKIPTLKEMIERANGKIKLMIELKKNDHEQDLVDACIELIKQQDVMDQCVISSMDDTILKQVKQKEPNMTTMYITPVLYGSYETLDFVDMFSIESAFVTKNVVDRIHMEDKKIFVWTINSEGGLKEYLSMGIDGIVTDNVLLAAYKKEEGYRDPFIDMLLEALYT